MKSSGRPHQFHFTFLGFLLLKTGLGERGDVRMTLSVILVWPQQEMFEQCSQTITTEVSAELV